jgi:hypothetical protein
VRIEVSLISVFVVQSALGTALSLSLSLSSVVFPPWLFGCLSVSLCVKYFCLNGFNTNPIIAEISYTKGAGMRKDMLYMSISTKDSY